MRKKLLFALLLITLGFTGAWANKLSKNDAQKLAQSFANSHFKKKKGDSKPKWLGQISGLHVFNMSEKGGFVIVSNDSRTTPILGYSDSGTFDPDNMPDNMRAWLQGYADEIAWLQNQKENNTVTVTKARTREGTHATTSIGPLLSTTWNQDTPYNNLCPEYSEGLKSATGCVATAMAQVMKYHEWPTAETAAIPEYTNNGVTRSSLPATTFDWDNMKDTYTGSETDETAVATLMQYCGYSIEMNYGPSSGAYTENVAYALVNYFDYDSNTMQWISRSSYSYANWTDIIYHELSQGRPVIYTGNTIDVGHCFVCDGYKLEDNTDLFHINWGWGGTSDGYFVLSVLNPSEQGIGGSASAGAYSFGQDAIIGIQKTGGTGTVHDIVKTKNDNNLTINNISLSHNTIALGESVNVIINVTNIGTNDYDGDLWLGNDKELIIGKTFVIPSGTTQDCVISYTPDATGQITLFPYYITSAGRISNSSGKSTTLTVKDQTPTDITASNITSNSATVEWTNVGQASKWNLRTRPVIYEDFDGNFSDWSEMYWSDTGVWFLSYGGIDGTLCFASPSYYDGVDLNPEIGLITPTFNLGASISFYAWGIDEHFVVCVNPVGDQLYQLSREETTTDVPTRYSFDLSHYTGQEGCIIIVHRNSGGHTSESFLHVDNVAIAEPSAVWTNFSNVASPYTLTGLRDHSGYEIQAQAVNNDGGYWSTSNFFKTTYENVVLADDATDNIDIVESHDEKEVCVSLTGRTLYKDGKWNTICLPFSLGYDYEDDGYHFYGTPFHGAEIRTLKDASLSEGTLTINFTDPVTSIKAGTPYIIKWTKAEGYDQADAQTRDLKDPVFTGVTINKTMSDQTCDLGNGSSITFCGTYTPFNFTSDDNTKLFIGAANTLYYPKSSAKINSCRAYFQLNGITAGDKNSQVRNFKLNFGDEETTGIITTNYTNFTNSDDAWYDLSGRKLSGRPIRKGVYLHNSRLVVIK